MASAGPRDRLLATAQALCNDFAAKASPDTLLTHFSATHSISALEHGLPVLAPFLGREFEGRDGPRSVKSYFQLLSEHLTYDNLEFVEWIVDPVARKVSVAGRGTFTWIEGKGKGQTWRETFVYVLDFDDDDKITDYAVWADSGAAYLAKEGELKQKMTLVDAEQ